MTRSVAIVGAGVGGLTAAVALLRAGLDVRVYEQARALSAVGAGIQLAPNCTRILGRLGLLPAVERVAVRPTTFEFRRWDDGRVLSRTALGDAVVTAYGAPYLNVHRGDLVTLLAEAVPADRVEVGRRCIGVVPGERGQVLFADGSRESADVVVGADGIHSVVRGSLFGAEHPRFTGHVAYRGLIPAARVAPLHLPRRCTVRLGPGAHVVHYFVGAGRLLNVVCVAEEPVTDPATTHPPRAPRGAPDPHRITRRRESWTDRADPGELRARFQGWHPAVRGIVDALDAPSVWALFDRDPLPSWGRGAVTLLGDACHPMLPYGAQGYAQAVEDAAVLATCLADPTAAVPVALARYAALRGDRASRVQAISRGNGARFHLPDGPGQQIRDAVLATSFGLSREISWLYGHDVEADARGGVAATVD